MAFKMNGWSAFTKNKDPKLSKKRIISATEFKTEDDVTVPTENMEFDELGNKVYRKGGKKYVKDFETGDFIHIPRKEIRRLKKEGKKNNPNNPEGKSGSYTSVRKIRKGDSKIIEEERKKRKNK